ncbi:MAG: methylmalonyl-CoA mutase family protein, partial [Sedimentibacter sp.]
SFFFNSHNDLFEEVAKFRAARRLWAKIMKERFKAKNEKSMMLKFHTQTAGCTLTAQQTDNNIIRVAMQALAAVLGGTQSLHTNSRDEALALPTQDSVTIALRTQQIIASETGVTNTIDPLAGSYFVEAKTKEIEDQAMEYIAKIDELGGATRAIDLGYIQKEISDSAYKYQMEIESLDRIVVGVNKYQVKEESPKGLLRVDPIVGEMQKKKTQKVKDARNNLAVKEKLEALKKACEGTENVMPLILDAVKEYATLGEICDVMREVFGEYEQAVLL